VGAAGKVGYATASALREAGRPVRAILRDPAKGTRLGAIGCEVAVADLQDTAALAQAMAGADAVQIILPVAPQAQDTIPNMERSIESLATALDHARPRQVLAISDYGAHATADIGMPSMFRRFEERLRRLDSRKLFLRSAEHMQGWVRAIPGAIASGTLRSFHDPVDKALPMISAPDLGRIAAELLLRPLTGADVEIVHAEGPHRYSPGDVAAVLSRLLGRTIEAQAVPRSLRQQMLERAISASAAELLFKLYDAHAAGGLIEIEPGASDVRHGTTELAEALRPLVPPQ